MKRYIRTKDGKIIDTTKFENVYYNELGYLILESEDTNYCINDDEIINQADTIEELIEVGDLVCFDGFICYVYIEKGSNRLFVWYPKEEVIAYLDSNYHCITELYTKQGNDYILVAKKEKEEWRVI